MVESDPERPGKSLVFFGKPSVTKSFLIALFGAGGPLLWLAMAGKL